MPALLRLSCIRCMQLQLQSQLHLDTYQEEHALRDQITIRASIGLQGRKQWHRSQLEKLNSMGPGAQYAATGQPVTTCAAQTCPVTAEEQRLGRLLQCFKVCCKVDVMRFEQPCEPIWEKCATCVTGAWRALPCQRPGRDLESIGYHCPL